MSHRRRFESVLLLMLLAAPLGAQELPGVAPSGDAAAPAWSWFGDGLLRANRTVDIPRAVEPDFSDAFARARVGAAWNPIPALEFGAAIKIAGATRDNADDRSSNFNERSNDVALDRFFLRWRAGDDASLLFGKTAFPLQLSPLLWDADLRPVGASADLSFAADDLDRVQLVAGYFAGDLPYGDDSRIGAIQAGFNWHEGAPVNGSVLAAYLDFSSLQQLALQGLSRTNRRVAGSTRLVSDYRLFDLQFVGRARWGDVPLEARLDLARNLGADDQRDAARASIVLGDMRQPGAWEFGLAGQRIGRDAVMAAFNSDDWWFHSGSRGIMPWVGYGFSATWSARLAAFHERRDGAPDFTDRVLLDLYARW